jgi:hypothetical protein
MDQLLEFSFVDLNGTWSRYSGYDRISAHQGLPSPLQSNILETDIQSAARLAKLVCDFGARSRPTSVCHGRLHSRVCLQARIQAQSSS